MKIRRFRHIPVKEKREQSTLDETLNVLAVRGYKRYDVEGLVSFLIAVRELIKEFALETYQEYVFDKNIK